MTKPLTIVHVDPERACGGGEVQVLGLLRYLADSGQRQVVAADPRGALANAAAALGIAIEPLPIRNHADVLAGRRLNGLLGRVRCDIVHFHTARAHAMSVFVGRSGPRRVVTRRMDYPLRGGWYARWLYNRGVDAVVAISEGVRAALVASGVDPARISVIASGVDVGRFAAANVSREVERARFGIGVEEIAVVVVAALEERKGHAVLLEAVARLGKIPLRVLCAGTGSQQAALAAQRDALGLARRVQFLGHVEDVASLLAAADIVAMPSLKEGLGVAALEALAAGRPLIASKVGGLPEVVAQGAAGLLVEPDDAAALGAAIDRLARDRVTARALGEAGQAHVRAHFTMEGMGAATLALYRRLCERNGTEQAP